MTNKKWYQSLGMHMLGLVLLGLLCAVAAFFIFSRGGEYLISNFYVTEEQTQYRQQQWIEKFDAFVQANQIRSDDTQSIAVWTEEQRYAYFLIFQGGTLTVEAGSWGANTVEDDENFWYVSQDEYDVCYPVHFADTTCAVTVYDFSEERLYTLKTVISLLLSGLAFLFVVIKGNRKLCKRIVVLSKNVREIAAGNLNKEIGTSGHDELTGLAQDMNQMRQSIIEQMKNEQLAWQANTDLIRAISHDIRTPLTALSGYLDLACKKQYETPQQLEQYLDICNTKTQQLRKLTDELFRYFLVFGNQNLNLTMEEYDASILIEQMLGERVCGLENQSYTIEWKHLQKACRICTDVMQLQRVMDNLFSNLEKYAEKTKPVRIVETAKNLRLHVSITNDVSTDGKRVESNKIGLRTCEKIMESLGGALTITQDSQRFCVELALPIALQIPEDHQERRKNGTGEQ